MSETSKPVPQQCIIGHESLHGADISWLRPSTHKPYNTEERMRIHGLALLIGSTLLFANPGAARSGQAPETAAFFSYADLADMTLAAPVVIGG